jgi:hypothetical protein
MKRRYLLTLLVMLGSVCFQVWNQSKEVDLLGGENGSAEGNVPSLAPTTSVTREVDR